MTDGQTDRQKVTHKSPPGMGTGGLKKINNLCNNSYGVYQFAQYRLSDKLQISEGMAKVRNGHILYDLQSRVLVFLPAWHIVMTSL